MEELASEHCGLYSDKNLTLITAFFPHRIHRSWGLAAHRGWAQLMLDHRCLGVFNAPYHRTRRRRLR